MRSRSVNMRREAWKYQNYLKFLFERNIIFPVSSPPSTCRSLVSWSHRIGMNGAAAWQRSALFVWKHQNKCPVKLFSYEPWKFDGLIKRGDGVVGENLQSNLPTILSEGLFKLDFLGRFRIIFTHLHHLLFGHGDAGSLIHPHVGDPHAAEDGKGLQEVLIVGGEVRAGTVHLVDTPLS